MKAYTLSFTAVMNSFLSVLVFTIIVLTSSSEKCDDLRAFKIVAKTDNEVKFLDEIKRNALELNVTLEKPARKMNQAFVFTVPDCKQARILSMMKKFQIVDYEFFNTKFVAHQEQTNLRRINLNSGAFDPDVVTKKYLSQDETLDYIDKMAAKISQANPKIIVAVQTEGHSYESRPIKSISIVHSERVNNPVIFIDAGIHAREWHSRSMALYLLNRFVDEAALDTEGLLYKASFMILPTVNPDGYEFSRNGNNMWRKTRSPVSSNCIGVDGNRNFDVHWWEGETEKKPCFDVYRGPKPFSELETKIVRDIMRRLKSNIKMYITLHTFGNMIVYPYGYTTTKHYRHEQLANVAQAGVDAVLEETGVMFTADQSGSSMYVAAGGSDDYAIEIGIPFAYTFELGAEELGFSVPEIFLNKTLNEGYIGIKAMVLQVIKM